MKERFVPIQIDQEQCLMCERCVNACREKAIYFKHGLRLVDYVKCKGCLACQLVCPRNAIQVSSVTSGEILTIKIDRDKCNLCMDCINKDGAFCPNNLFTFTKIKIGNKEEDGIHFNYNEIARCQGCLKCEAACPEHAINPVIYEE